MKNQPSSKKTIIAIVLISGVALIAYFYFSGSSAPADSSFVESQSESSAAVGTRTLNLLNQIQSLRIDTSIFKDKAYQNLTDYSVIIPPVGVGRSNPFAPLSGVQSAVAGQ